MSPPHNPEPSIALVTGAGRGLGRALTLELASRGLSVAALGRTASDLEAVAEEARSARVVPVVADVGDPEALRSAFSKIDQELGSVDTLINSAAVYPHRDFLEETPTSFQQTMAINLGGMATCSMFALERMIHTGFGRIINVTSFADVKPTHLSSAYSVSKGAGRVLTRAVTRDVSFRFPNIVINEWIPGALQTEMGVATGHDPAEAAKWGAALALMRDPELAGLTFFEDAEQLPVLSLKRRLWNKISGQGVHARSLT